MGQSVLVFISHSSEDKESFIDPIVSDLEECYINVWIDKKKILPGDNLRKSIFKDGLDKADIVLIFFTENSLRSHWVDREIKHVLRGELSKENNFDLRKIISIFDSENTYSEIKDRFPELTDDLMHLMPLDYSKIQIGQLISSIWSKYLSLQGEDIETQKQLLSKDKELFEKDKEIENLKQKLAKSKTDENSQDEFEQILKSRKIDMLLHQFQDIIVNRTIDTHKMNNAKEAFAFGLMTHSKALSGKSVITQKGLDFYKWYLLQTPKT